MSCPEWSEDISALLDGELSEPQAARVQDHLRACDDCQRHQEELQGTVRLLRGLERPLAPAFSMARARAAAVAEAREARAERWAQIRSQSTALPRSGARSIAYAALVFILAFVIYQSVGNVNSPIPGGQPAPEPAPAGPGAAQAVPEEEHPEWLRREIARRVLEAREADAHREPTAGPVGEDAVDPAAEPAGTAMAAGGPSADGNPAGAPPPDPPVLPEPGERLAAAQEPPAARDEPPLAGPVAGDTRTLVTELRGNPDSRPTSRQLVVGIPVAPGPSPQAPAPSDPPAARAERRSPGRAGAAQPEAPAATDIEISHRALASLIESEGAEEIVFHDADVGDVDPMPRSGPGTATEREELPMERAPLPEPEPDPLTGITPPVPIDRPGPDLGDRRLDRRAWGELAPLAARLIIDGEGSVERAELVTRSGLDWLDEAMVQALHAWTFRPAERGGQPIPVRIEIVVEFELD